MAKKSIGEANVKLTVDGAEQVKADMREVKAETEGVGKAMGDTVQGVDRGIKSFRRLAGMAAFATGAISALISVVSQLAGGLRDVQDAANGMGNDIRKATDPSQFEGMSEKLREAGQNAGFIQRGFLQASGEIDRTGKLTDELSFAFGRVLNVFTGAANEQGKAFRDINRTLADAAEIRRKELNTARDLAAQSQIQLAIENERIAGLDGIEQIEAQSAQRSMQREKQIQEARKQGLQEQVDLLEKLSNQEQKNFGDRIRSIRQEKEERERAEREQKRQREEQEAQRKLEQAMRELQREMAEQAKAINDNTRELSAMRSRIINFTPDIRRGSQALTRRTR